MISLRVLAAGAFGAAVAVIAARTVTRLEGDPPPAATTQATDLPPAAAAHPADPLPSAATKDASGAYAAPVDPCPTDSDAPSREPLPPAPQSGAPNSRVPPGVLSRAAEARALERGPSCAPRARAARPSHCPPDQRDCVEIHWHVAPGER